MTNIILPTEMLDRWRVTFSRRAVDKLEAFLELRAFLEADAESNPAKLMQVYREAGEAMRYSANTVRHNLAALRGYPDAKLREWIASGLSFSALSTVGELESMGLLNAPPAQVLDEAVGSGGPDGSTMTADEVLEYATGHLPGRTAEYRMTRACWQLARLSKLDTERGAAFVAELRELLARYQ